MRGAMRGLNRGLRAMMADFLLRRSFGSIPLTPESEEGVKILFQAMDFDQDGYVEPADIEKSLQMLGAPDGMVRAEVADLMSRDAGKDGKLSAAEFCAEGYELAGNSAQFLAQAITTAVTQQAVVKEAKSLSGSGSPFFDFLVGEQLLDNLGQSSVETKEVIEGKKYVGIYLSAHWCPPCRKFTPQLAKAYEAINSQNPDELAVIFVSCDRTPEAFREYLQEMPWQSVDFEGDKDYIGFSSRAGSFVECSSIPTLGIFDAQGNLITKDGVDSVRGHAELFLETFK
ncbi:hypothetical protein AAMO2058_000643200 [Amorphochlora amoebiformis]